MNLVGKDIDWGDPVNRNHFLTTAKSGLVGFWLAPPGWNSGLRLPNLLNLGDASGRGFHAALINGPAWASGPNGFGSLRFDGSDDYAMITNPTSTYTQVTVAVDFVHRTQPSIDQRLAEKGANDEWTMVLGPTGGANRIFFYNRHGGTGDDRAATGPTLTPGVRYQAVGVIGDSPNATLYVRGEDGINTVSVASVGSAPTGGRTGDLSIGRFGGGGFYGAFQLHSLALLDVAWSASEVAEWMDQCRYGFPDVIRRVSPAVLSAESVVPNSARLWRLVF